jgi:hypothetical protein
LLVKEGGNHDARLSGNTFRYFRSQDAVKAINKDSAVRWPISAICGLELCPTERSFAFDITGLCVQPKETARTHAFINHMDNTIPWTWAIGRPFQSIKGFHFIAIAPQTTLNVTQKSGRLSRHSNDSPNAGAVTKGSYISCTI